MSPSARVTKAGSAALARLLNIPAVTAEVTVRRGLRVPMRDGVELIAELNAIAGRHGVGRIDHIENRLVGIKSREIYEAAAAVVLHEALGEVENAIGGVGASGLSAHEISQRKLTS